MSALTNLKDLDRELHQLRAIASADLQQAQMANDRRRADFIAGQLHAYTEVLKRLARYQPTPRRKRYQ